MHWPCRNKEKFTLQALKAFKEKLQIIKAILNIGAPSLRTSVRLRPLGDSPPPPKLTPPGPSWPQEVSGGKEKTEPCTACRDIE